MANNVSTDESEDDQEDKKKTKTKIDKLFAQKNLTVLSEHYRKLKQDEEEEEDFLTLARQDHDVSDEDVVKLANPNKKITKTQKMKR